MALEPVSRGGYLGLTMLAIELRFKAGVLVVAGLELEHEKPGVDAFNFAAVPVLMLNGKYDQLFAIET